ncbi:MAG: TIGR00299 family protein, partial [Nitrospiraceae bacterium]
MTDLHFDCFSGISGDMTLGALVDAGLPFKDLARALKAVPVGGYRLRSTRVHRGGLHATKIDVVIHQGSRSPFSLSRIQRIIASSRIPPTVKEQSHEVFDRLAKAEGLAHRVSPSRVVFHEVGVVDSLVDVMGSLLACHLLGVNRITASPVNLGSGFIESVHGTLPAPGPAVVALARGIPVYSAGPARELTTPTGLALLAT